MLVGVTACVVLAVSAACAREDALSRRLEEEDGTIIAQGVADDGDAWSVWIRGDDPRCLSYTGGGGSGGGMCFVAVPHTWADEARTAPVGDDESIVFGAVDRRAVEVRVIDDDVDEVAPIISLARGDFAYYVVEVPADDTDLLDAHVLAVDGRGDAFGADGWYVWDGPPPSPPDALQPDP